MSWTAGIQFRILYCQALIFHCFRLCEHLEELCKLRRCRHKDSEELSGVLRALLWQQAAKPPLHANCIATQNTQWCFVNQRRSGLSGNEKASSFLWSLRKLNAIAAVKSRQPQHTGVMCAQIYKVEWVVTHTPAKFAHLPDTREIWIVGALSCTESPDDFSYSSIESSNFKMFSIVVLLLLNFVWIKLESSCRLLALVCDVSKVPGFFKIKT